MGETAIPLTGMVTISVALVVSAWLMAMDVKNRTMEKFRNILVFTIFGLAFLACLWLEVQRRSGVVHLPL